MLLLTVDLHPVSGDYASGRARIDTVHVQADYMAPASVLLQNLL